VRFWWSHETIRPESGTRVPPVEDASKGRTDGHTVLMRFGFEDGPAWSRVLSAWTRPGKGRALVRELVPPGGPEELPFGAPVEIVAAAVVDLEGGDAALRAGDGASELVMPRPAAAGDRGEVRRLWLEVLPPE
jgi:hypothetical protein